MNIGWMFISTLYMVNLVAVVLLLFVEKKNPTVTLSWLLVITFMPFFGMLLYFMLGSTYKLKIMTHKYSLEKVEEEYRQAFLKLKNEKEPSKETYKYYKDMILLNEKNASSIFTQKNDCKLHIMVFWDFLLHLFYFYFLKLCLKIIQ